MTRRLLAAFVSCIVLQAGCADDTPAPPVCRDGNSIGDVCVGVPNDPVCEEEYCTQGVQCAQVIEVNSGSAYAEAVGRAQAGTCIALAPGVYGGVPLPQGVSLLGRGADFVTVGGLDVGGDGVTVRGVTVSGPLTIRDGTTTVAMVRIADSMSDGITAGAGSTVTIDASEVQRAERYGVSAFDVANLTVNNSIIHGKENGGGPGIWAQCNGGCDCSGSTNVSMSNVKLVANSIVGLSLVGANATLHNVEVRNTTVGGNFEAGGGISASACSSVQATALTIVDNADFGLLLDDSALDVDGLTASGNLRGVWIQNVGMSMPASALVRNGEVTGNLGVGIGVAGESQDVTIEATSISETKLIALPVLVGGVSAGAESVGDGITWKLNSKVILNGVTVSSSARASVLIDDSVGAGSSISNVVLTGGDELLGIVQQNFDQGVDVQPNVTASPPLQVSMEELHAVPEDLGIPPTI